MARKPGMLPAGLVKGVDPAKAGSAEMFARFLAPTGTGEETMETQDGAGGATLDVPDSTAHASPTTVEEPVVDTVAGEERPVVDVVANAAGSSDDPAPPAGTGPDLPVVPSGDTGIAEATKASVANGRAKPRKSGEGAGRNPRRTPEFPPMPPASALPARLDASYIPRQLFIRLPVELRDRLREIKTDLAESGTVMTDGEIVEAGCRLLPGDLEGMYRVSLNYAMRRERGAVPFSPQVRTDLHAWLENVNACLRGAGLRVSVNTIALTALEAFVDAAERR